MYFYMGGGGDPPYFAWENSRGESPGPSTPAHVSAGSNADKAWALYMYGTPSWKVNIFLDSVALGNQKSVVTS